MGGINLGRVLAGGVVAGVVHNVGEAVLNTGVLAADREAFQKEFSLPPVGGDFIMKATIFMFAVGIVNVFLYAPIRPRFGAGIKTAVIAGLLVWGLSFLYMSLFNMWLGLFAMGPTLLGVGWELVEAILASIAGAWVYR
jgi:hypothetical protein